MSEKEFYRWLDVDCNTVLLSQKESFHDANGDYERTWVINNRGIKYSIVETNLNGVVSFGEPKEL
jgi:hypothetical protein